MTKWQWILMQFSKKLWLRASLFCLVAVASAMLAALVKDFIPEDISRKVGAEAVDGLLHIIANSMLAVAIFSLSTMVAAYSAATTNATPRSTKLLLEDNTSQNALSTFIGSFLFSLVGIIALAMGVYGESGRLILFAVTITVIVVIVTVLIRWFNYLSELGRVGKTIDMVERVTKNAIRDRIRHPYLDGAPLEELKEHKHYAPIHHESIGYVQYIDIPAMSELAKEEQCEVFVRALPGNFNDGVRPLAYVSKKLEPEKMQVIAECFHLDDDRSFEQDPRFGLIVLSEIASRALSPAVNDPGTAIDVIGTAVRVLAPWARRKEIWQAMEKKAKEDGEETGVKYPNIHVPPLLTADMFDDLFTPIARDGAGMIEVQIRLQKALQSLAALGDEETKREAKRHAELALKRAKAKLNIDADIERLERLL